VNTRAAIVSPVRLELDDAHVDRLHATVDVTLNGRDRFRVTAVTSHQGRILDLQSHGDPWRAGTTGDPDLDHAVVSAIGEAFIAARNATAIIELGRRIRYRGRRTR
jgi:hypothetical protein